jgi:hypothetical protein
MTEIVAIRDAMSIIHLNNVKNYTIFKFIKQRKTENAVLLPSHTSRGFPDCRGPVIATTGNAFAKRSRAFCSCL